MDDNQLLQELFQIQAQSFEDIKQQFLQQQFARPKQFYQLIDKIDQLRELKIQTQILGIDMEQTNDMGFDGRLSLIQIKDNDSIYIIDVLELSDDHYDELLQKLEQIFTDPKIVKVFYSGQQDLLWLQRDFKLKINGYFDIKELADLADKNGKNSIIQLWSSYCDYKVSKSYKNEMQTSDWSERPLSNEQLYYAAMDCHFLPYLRQELLTKLLQKQNINDCTKLMKTFHKIQQKEYKLPILNDSQLLKQANKYLSVALSTLEEINNNNQEQQSIKISVNSQAVIKFLMLELLKARQASAIHSNNPVDSLDENDDIALIAIHIFKRLKIENINQFQQFYNLQNYENKQYEITKEYINQEINNLEWEEIRKLLCKGLYQSFQYDKEFTKYVLDFIYNLENDKPNNGSQQKLQQKKQKQQEFEEKYTRQKPAYGNCQIFTPEGQLLCNCDEKKVRWYLKQGLGELIQGDGPLSVKLNFEPSGFKETGKDTKQLITIERVNQCVVCGKEQSLLKYHIVPVIYKKHIQGKRTYDVVCLCMICHNKANAHADKLKKNLLEKFNLQKIQIEEEQNIFEEINNLVKANQKYQKTKDKQPENARIKQEQTFCQRLKQLIQNQEFFNLIKQINQDLNIEELQSIYNQNFENFIDLLHKNLQTFKQLQVNSSEGEMVVKQLKNEEEIIDFLSYWRDEFINYMSPQYLTEAWAIDHKFQRTYGEKSVFNPKNKQNDADIIDNM